MENTEGDVDLLILCMNMKTWSRFIWHVSRVLILEMITVWKVSKYKVISGPNIENFEPEITPYLDTFHIVNGLG